MNNELTQACAMIQIILSIELSKGSDVWTFEDYDDFRTELNGKIITLHELSDLAINFKRKADYISALNCYAQILTACSEGIKKIPILYIKGLYKVFMAANYYKIAFSLIAPVTADLQNRRDTPKLTMAIYFDYFRTLVNTILLAADTNNLVPLTQLSRDFSGNTNYKVTRPINEIKEEVSQLRTLFKTEFNI